MRLNLRPNLGPADQTVRVIVSLALFAVVYAGWLTGGWAIAAIVFAASQLLEATLGY